MRFDSRSLLRVPPPSFIRCSDQALTKNTIGFGVDMRRELATMQHHFRLGKSRDETTNRCPVTAQRRMCLPQHFVDIEAVGFLESFFEKLLRNSESDVTQIGRRGEVTVGKFGNVECELCSDMAVRAFVVRDRRPKPARQLGKLDG